MYTIQPSTPDHIQAIPNQPRLTIDHYQLNSRQRQVALLTVITPLVGVVIAVSFLWQSGWVSPIEMGLLMGMYVLSMLGITVGFHRHFAHRAFETTTAVRVMLAILGAMAAQGPVIHWVSNHRRHHGHSDQPGDPHSPHLYGSSVWGHLRGAWHAHMGWLFQTEMSNSLLFAKDLLQDPVIRKVNKYYGLWVCLGIIIPAVGGGLISGTWMGSLNGLLWGGLVRIFLAHHATWSVNSITHLYGQRPFETSDHSTNNLWVALPTLGEGWHNNHHAFPKSAIFGLKWWQIDVGGWLIRSLELVGLAWQIKRPTQQRLQQKIKR